MNRKSLVFALPLSLLLGLGCGSSSDSSPARSPSGAKQPNSPVTPAATSPKPSEEGPAHASQPAYYYTCTMHPQIDKPGPGDCPICGMTLVKKERSN